MMTCPFDEYLKLPGLSYSDAKGGVYTKPTAKMILGTYVHQYMLEPENYNYENIDIVRPLAVKLKQAIGPLFKYLLPEQAGTATYEYEGFALPVKGRGDLVAPKRILIDIKVSEMPLHKFIAYFGTENQTSHYAAIFDCPLALVAQINPKNKLVTVYNVPITMEFWKQQILTKGEPKL